MSCSDGKGRNPDGYLSDWGMVRYCVEGLTRPSKTSWLNAWHDIMVSMNQCKGELAECASKYYVYLVNYSCICVGTYVNMQCVNA